MESTRCPICAADDFGVVFEGPDWISRLPGLFRMVRCLHCGLYYLNPRPDQKEIHRYYPHDYLAFQKSIEEETAFLKRMDRRYGIYKRCRSVTKVLPGPGKILDIGCATGLFLSGMQDRGWECLGIELNEQAATYARERMGLDIITGNFLEADLPDHYFDVISLWDVLEHLPDPLPVLEKISKIIRPGGLLVLNLPNPESWEAKRFGPLWIGWDLPRHLNLFPLPLLTSLLRTHGFGRPQVKSLTGNFFVFKFSLGLLLNEKISQRPAASKILRSLLNSPVSRLVAFPVYALADPLKLGSCLALFFRFEAGSNPGGI
jgi:SAM-dependent methyltransferase